MRECKGNIIFRLRNIIVATERRDVFLAKKVSPAPLQKSTHKKRKKVAFDEMNQFLFASFLCYLLFFVYLFLHHFFRLFRDVEAPSRNYRLIVCARQIVASGIPGIPSPTRYYITLHFYPALYLHSYPASTTAAIRVLTETLERASTTAFLLSRSTDTAETPLTPSSAF